MSKEHLDAVSLRKEVSELLSEANNPVNFEINSVMERGDDQFLVEIEGEAPEIEDPLVLTLVSKGSLEGFITSLQKAATESVRNADGRRDGTDAKRIASLLTEQVKAIEQEMQNREQNRLADAFAWLGRSPVVRAVKFTAFC